MAPKFSFSLLLMITFFGTKTAQGQCLPDCSSYPSGFKVRHPRYCSMYFVCLDSIPSDMPTMCEEGYEFEFSQQDCILPYGCTTICPPFEGCHLTCTDSADRVADPDDCSVFYSCIPGYPDQAYQCGPDAPFFNGEMCGIDSAACCKQGCDPFCEYNVLQVADPNDCTKYYRCRGNPVYPIYPPVSCNPGEVFDSGIGHCSATAECKVLCPDVPPPDDCLDNLQCAASGFFRKCPYCDPRFFFCSEAGQLAVEGLCSDGMVFNPVPEYAYCITPGQCPYTPPK